MILDQIAWVDCIAFLLFLAPQLLIQVGLIPTAICGLQALPYLCKQQPSASSTDAVAMVADQGSEVVVQMPWQLLIDRYLTATERQAPFVQHATLFQDVVIRCVRYAFAYIPAKVGNVFLSKAVALPFFRFRMLRHGYLRSPIYWKEVGRNGLRGIYMVLDETRRPDIMVYYCHGGGFSMASSSFYIEFLLAWVSLLHDAGYENPALFALDYTLAPAQTYPTQVQETLNGYKYCLSLAPSSARIVVSGDSAGATLILSLLLCLPKYAGLKDQMPGLAIPISPWAAIISPDRQDTPSDYLNVDSLHLYGSQYIGTKASPSDPLVSPARCKDLAWWRRASPTAGWFFIYGAEEVFAPDARDLIDVLKKAGAEVSAREEKGWIHAWPVVKLFLCNTRQERISGLKAMVDMIKERISEEKAE